jgi:hypothetical protein
LEQRERALTQDRPESLEHLNMFYKTTIEIKLQKLKEIGYRGSELYTVNDVHLKKERLLASIRLTNKVKTSVNSIFFTEGSRRTTRDHHYFGAYPQAE